MQPPGADLPAEAFARVLADRRVEAEQVPARLRPDLSDAELIAQERERGVLGRATPACVLAVSGSPGESHPRAPTERSVTISRHSALTIQSGGTGASTTSARTGWGR